MTKLECDVCGAWARPEHAKEWRRVYAKVHREGVGIDPDTVIDVCLGCCPKDGPMNDSYVREVLLEGLRRRSRNIVQPAPNPV